MGARHKPAQDPSAPDWHTHRDVAARMRAHQSPMGTLPRRRTVAPFLPLRICRGCEL
jgi:hypothetical protein